MILQSRRRRRYRDALRYTRLPIRELPPSLRTLFPSVFPSFELSYLSQSQTQYGTRYTKQLTRFYATVSPSELFSYIEEALAGFEVKYKRGPVDAKRQSARLRVGGFDNRNVAYKGWIDVEPFSTLDCPSARTYCLLSRDEVRILPVCCRLLSLRIPT